MLYDATPDHLIDSAAQFKAKLENDLIDCAIQLPYNVDYDCAGQLGYGVSSPLYQMILRNITVSGQSWTNILGDVRNAGANGLRAGLTFLANTWYYVFAIYKPSDNTFALFFDTDPFAPVLPTGYKFGWLLGAQRTDALAHFNVTYMKNGAVMPVTGSAIASGVYSTSDADLSALVPPIATSISGIISVTDGCEVQVWPESTRSFGGVYIFNNGALNTGLAKWDNYELDLLSQHVWWACWYDVGSFGMDLRVWRFMDKIR